MTGAEEPLFGSIQLAARIEAAECRLLTDGAETIRRRTGSPGIFVTPLAGGVAVFTEAGSPLNKVSGLGFDGPLDTAELDAVEQAYRDRGVPVNAEVCNLADPAIGQTLTRRGYVLTGFENVLACQPVVGEGDNDIEVSTIGDAEIDVWIDTLVTGFATPDKQGIASHESFPREVLEPLMRDVAKTSDFGLYLARREGVVAGGASMRSVDGVTLLCGAATLPEHRRRGVQTALLRRRLSDACASGSDIVTVTTQPGSKSQQNSESNGFRLLYSRAILVREA